MIYLNLFVRMALLLTGLLGAVLPAAPAWAAEPVRIGVLAVRGEAQTREQWQPLAAALKQALPERDFEVEVLSKFELDVAVASRLLDFVLTNPGHYVELSRNGRLSAPLATLLVEQAGQQTALFGGVIFSRAELALPATLSELKGKTIAAVSDDSLSGYQMQAYELKQAGINLAQDAKLLLTGIPQDKVVDAVLAGRADVGFVRTGVLEAMASEDKLDLKKIRFLNRQDLTSFPFQTSTALYPEWPFANLPHTDPDLARHVTDALFLLHDNSAATRLMGNYGFTVPADYTPVAKLLREMRFPPFEAAPAFTLQDVWSRYRWFITGALLALGLILLLGLRLLRTTRKLRVEITEHRLAEDELQLSVGRRASVFDNAFEGIMIIDTQGLIIDINQAFTHITGYSSADVLGQNPRILSSGRQSKEFYAAMWRDLQENGRWSGEVWNRRKSGEVYAQFQNLSVVRDAQGNIRQYISLFSDITTLKEQQQRLEHLAHFDALTDLPNRTLLADRLHQSMAQAQRRGQLLALVFLDLDGFKRINDDHGHEAGDHMLTTLARRMTQVLREGDTLARVGGDEFVAVLIDLADVLSCEPMLARLLDAAAQPVQFGEIKLQVSASTGVSFYPQAQALGFEQLLHQADQAMYQAKASGKNCYRIFEAALVPPTGIGPVFHA